MQAENLHLRCRVQCFDLVGFESPELPSEEKGSKDSTPRANATSDPSTVSYHRLHADIEDAYHMQMMKLRFLAPSWGPLQMQIDRVQDAKAQLRPRLKLAPAAK